MDETLKKKYKHSIVVVTGNLKNRRDRTFTFYSNDDGLVAYFNRRSSFNGHNFPQYIKGEMTETDDSGGYAFTLFDFLDKSDLIKEFYAPNIVSLEINGKDINDEYMKQAGRNGFYFRAPLIYHLQFFPSDIPHIVFNWFPTTGSLNKQVNSNATRHMYHVKKLPEAKDAEIMFRIIKDECFG